jgi:hypothetical protein
MKNSLIAFSLSILVFGSCTKKDPVQYALTTSVVPVDGGTVSPSSGLYKEGESVVLTATPSSEYLFTGWSDGASGTANPMTVVMNSKKSIIANFEKRKYPLSITIDGDGTVKEEVVQTKSATNYYSGTFVKLSAVSNKGSEFVGWSGDYLGSDSTYIITVDKPKSLTASFNKLIYPTASLSGNDSILIGDTTKVKTQFTGTPPFSFDYNDGVKTFTVSNINSLNYTISFTPKQSTIFKLVSVKDKNRNGTVSGSFEVYVQPHFVSKTASYKGINLTVGNINNNLTFRGSYYHIDELKKSFVLDLKDNKGNVSDYWMSDHSYVFFDYNNDGYLDLFGWLYNGSPVFGRNNGKHILVNNVLGGFKKKITYFDSDIAWPSGMEVNDFNGDGIPDVVFYSYNDHNDMGGLVLNTAKPVKVFLFNKDGTIKETNATIPLIVHDMASGDVDNDGDVDLLVWEYSKICKPRLYTNNGLANFIEAPESTFKGLTEIMNSRSGGFSIIAVELFDINSDGFLDIIAGNEIGGRTGDFTYVNDYLIYKLPQQRIYWGNGSGKFDFTSNFTDLPCTSIKQWSRTQPSPNDSTAIFDQNSKIALGFNFIDFDNDGDYDVLTAITPKYSGYILQLHENMGNKTFKDVTIEKIGNYDGLYNGSLNQYGYHIGIDGDFPNFYEIRPYDVDGDGDLDLVPHGVACWEAFKYSKNRYWENIGGKFILHK